MLNDNIPSEELNKKDKKEEKELAKEESKKGLKTVIISTICIVLFIVVILLFVLLGLKNCKRTTDSSSLSSSSEPSSSQKYNYDNNKLDNVFKKIVAKQMLVDGFDEDPLTNVLAVSYTDNNGSFDLDISVRSATKMYYYHLDNSTYTGYDDFVSYILDIDIDNKAGRPLDGDDSSINVLSITSDVITTDKVCSYAISKDDIGTNKYLSGYYYDNNQYHVYLKKEITSNNPFTEQADMVINSDDILFGYYQSAPSVLLL